MGKIITLVNSSEMIKRMCMCFSHSAKSAQWWKMMHFTYLPFQKGNETIWGNFPTGLICFHTFVQRTFFSLYFHNKITQFSLKIRSFLTNGRKNKFLYQHTINAYLKYFFVCSKYNNMISISILSSFRLGEGRGRECKIKKGHFDCISYFYS